MKRLISKVAYSAKGELERLIGYLVTRRSGLKLDQKHFDEIIEHFHDNGGHLKGIQSKKEKGAHYEKLHNSIDTILRKHKMK